jgi:ankyrin repeat protein
MKKIFCVFLLGCSALVWGADDSIALRLQKGLFEEEANHNLPAAIEQYKAVITATDEQRKLAATALFRLGESYHKLGREEEANEAYSRVVRDFSDQKEIATKASERISGATPPLVSMTAKTSEGGSATNDKKLATLAALLDTSPDLLNSEYKNGMTLLQNAIGDGDFEEMRFLIKRGADVNKGGNGGMPLYEAVVRGNRSAAELLIEAGANIDAHGVNGYTALHAAALHGFTILSELLLDKGADINARNFHAETPLYLAASGGFASTVELLIKRGADVEKGSIEGMTPLGIAVQRRNTQVVKILIKAGANPNTPSREGESPLLLAVKNKDNECAEILLASGADVNAADKNGVTPLIFSVWHCPDAGAQDYQAILGMSELIINTLLQHHADVNLTVAASGGWEGRSAIHFSADSYGSTPARILEILLKHGGNTNLQDAKGETPLHLAAGAGGVNPDFGKHGSVVGVYTASAFPRVNDQKIALLLQYKANPNIADDKGLTPLFYAVRGDFPGSAYAGTRALLLANADSNVKDRSLLTVLDYATETNPNPNYHKDPRLVPLLKEHGARSGIDSNRDGGTKQKETSEAVTNTTQHSSRLIQKSETPAQQVRSTPQ